MSRCFAWLRKQDPEELSALGNNMAATADDSEQRQPGAQQLKVAVADAAAAAKVDTSDEPEIDDEFDGADITVLPMRTLASHLLPPPPKRDWDVQKEKRSDSLWRDRPEYESARELQRTPESDESGLVRSDFVTRIPISTTGSAVQSNDVTGVSAVMVTAGEPYGGGGRSVGGGAIGGARSVTGISAVMVTGDDPYTSGTARGKSSNKLADNWFEKEDGEGRHGADGRSVVGDYETYLSVPTSPRSTNGKPKLFRNLSDRMGLTNNAHETLERSNTMASYGPSSSGNRTPSVAGSATGRSYKASSSANWFSNNSKKGGRRNSRTGSQRSTRSKSRDRRLQETGAQDGAPTTLPRLSRSVAGSARRGRSGSKKLSSKDREGAPREAGGGGREREWDKRSVHSGKSGRSATSRGRGRSRDPDGREPRTPKRGGCDKSRDPDGREPRTPRREGRDKSRDPAVRPREARDDGGHVPSAPQRGERGEREGRNRAADPPVAPEPRGRSQGREPRKQSQGRMARQPSQGREGRDRGHREQEQPSRDPLARQPSRGPSREDSKEGSAEGAPVKQKAKDRDGLKSSYISKWPFESRHPDELSFQAGAVLYPLAYAEDEGWLWMSVQKKSFRKGVSRGNVGEGEGLVPVTHLVNGETIPRKNWQEARVPAGMVRVDTIPTAGGGGTPPGGGGGAKDAASPVQASLGLPAGSLIPAAQARAVQRTVPPEELKQASTVSNTLAQWKAIDAQAAIQKREGGNSMDRSAGSAGAAKRQFPVDLRPTPGRADVAAKELNSNKIGFA